MFDTKVLLLSVGIAAVLGTVLAVLLNAFAPGFAEASPLIKGALIGAPCGLIYPLLARTKTANPKR